jgi:hypothetical protein
MAGPAHASRRSRARARHGHRAGDTLEWHGLGVAAAAAQAPQDDRERTGQVEAEWGSPVVTFGF